MAVVVDQSDTGESNTTIDFDFAAGGVADNALIIVAMGSNSSSGMVTPAGWTRIAHSAVGDYAAAFYLNVAGPAPSSAAFKTSGSQNTAWSWVSFILVTFGTSTANEGSGTVNIPSFTHSEVLNADDLWLTCAAGRNGGNGLPSGYTNINGTTAASGAWVRLDKKIGAGSATENPGAQGGGTSEHAAILFALVVRGLLGSPEGWGFVRMGG